MRGLLILSLALVVVLVLFSMMQSLSGVVNPDDTESVQKVIPAPDFVDLESLNLPTDYTLPEPPSLPESPQGSSQNSGTLNPGKSTQSPLTIEFEPPKLPSLEKNAIQLEPNTKNKN